MKTGQTLNQISGILNLIIGSVTIYEIFHLTILQLNQLKKLYTQNGIEVEINLPHILWAARFQILLGALLFFSGIYLLLRKKTGWILGYSAWMLALFFLLDLILYFDKDVTTTKLANSHTIISYFIAGIIFSLFMWIIFSLKPVRDFNQINRKTWINTSLLILAAFIILKLI